MNGWETLDGLRSDKFERFDIAAVEERRRLKVETFDRYLRPEPIEREYYFFCESGIRTGVIKYYLPYEAESSVIRRSRPMLDSDDSRWYTGVYGYSVTAQNISYEQRFCQSLRAGIDDAYAFVPLAILPNVSMLSLRAVQMSPTALELPYHAPGFEVLRTLKVGNEAKPEVMGDHFRFWGLDYLEAVLAKAPLEALYLQGASSCCQQDPDSLDRLITLRLEPGSLILTNWRQTTVVLISLICRSFYNLRRHYGRFSIGLVPGTSQAAI